MLKKFFTLLFAVLWCTVLLAQEVPMNDVDPNGDPTGGIIDAPGDVLYGWDLDALTGENGNLGVEYAYGYLWVTSRGLVSPLGNKVTKIDVTDPMNPVVVDSMSQGTTSAWGWRDMAYDGTYLYASDSDSVVQFDPATMTVTGSFPGVNNPNRALAWDPVTDHFWTASFTSDMWEFDRTGAIINQFPSATSMYGAGWDSWSTDGPWLWANGGTGTNVIQVDPLTGLATGTSYWVSGSSDGGLDI
ncbi:MAG: hypothetical protein HKM87_10025, partial [Ignavibacteriaceae bacterium]|nr:hypothetical protein [Ignavibacteriaceae bacterium]